MLGVNVKRELVKGKFAREIRERMRRILSEELNENDKKEIRKHKQIMKDITVVFDLLESFFSTFIQFQLDDINVVFRLNSHVYAALAGSLFHLHIIAQHDKNQVERVLEILFLVRPCYHVASACQHGLDGLQQVIGVSSVF